MVANRRRLSPLTIALCWSTLVSLGFFGYGALRNHSLDYWYLVWNLFLAYLPLAFMFLLRRYLQFHRWSSWGGIALSALWLSFLPNSFYMVTDYIHLRDTARVDVLYDAIMFTTFILNGWIAGFVSLYLAQRELSKRLPARHVWPTVSLILFICSFAIYLGRDLRWNTWDLLTNPAGLLFDISDRFINIHSHWQMVTTTLTCFVLLSTFYLVGYNLVRAVRLEGAGRR